MRLLAGVTVFCVIVCRWVTAEEEKPAETSEPVRRSVHFVGGPIYFLPTPPEIVREMLWLADAGPEDVVYDLDPGMGALSSRAVRDFGAKRAVGVELDPALIKQSRENAEQSHVSDRATFREEICSRAISATLPSSRCSSGMAPMCRCARLFDLLPPGVRIVSSQAKHGEWKPNKELTTFQTRGRDVGHDGPSVSRLPTFRAIRECLGHEHAQQDLLWVMPAPVAGVWVTNPDVCFSPRIAPVPYATPIGCDRQLWYWARHRKRAGSS